MTTEFNILASGRRLWRHQRWGAVIRAVIVAVVYFLGARLGLLFVSQPEGIASLWPPSGILLAALLLVAPREWPVIVSAIFISNTLANAQSGNAWLVSLSFAAANCAESVLAAAVVLRWVGRPPDFTEFSQVAKFISGAVVASNVLTGLIGALVVSLGLGAPFVSAWLTWVLADGTGMLIITPLILVGASLRPDPANALRPVNWLEAGFLLACVIGAGLVIFNQPPDTPLEHILRNYWMFPLLIWGGLRFGRPGTVILLFALALIVLAGVIRGLGPFIVTSAPRSSSIFAAQLFLCVAAITSLSFVGVLAERKRAEEKLQESEADLKRSQALAHLGHWRWDTRANTVAWSDEMYRIFGLDPATFIGDLNAIVTQAVHPDDRENVERANAAVLVRQAPAPIEYRVRWGDGTVRWVWAQPGHQERDAAGQITALVGVVQDITARKVAEQELRDAEARYRALFEQLPDGAVVTDLDTHLPVEFNDTACRQLGYTRAEFAQLRINDYEVQESPTETAAHIAQLLATGHAEFTTRHRTKPGEVRQIQVNAQAITIAERRVAYTIYRDITEQVLAETRFREDAERAAFLLALSLQSASLTEHAVYTRALEEAVRFTQSEIGYLHQINTDQITLTLTAWNAGALKQCTAVHDTHYPLDQAGVWADCIRLKQPVIHNDYQHLPERRGYPEGHAHLLRHMSLPILSSETVLFIIGVGNKATDYTEADVQQLQLFANQIQHLLMRRRAEAALQDRESHLRATLEALPDLMFELDAAGRLWDYRAPNLAALYMPPGQFLTRPVHELLPPEAVQVVQQAIQQTLATGRATGHIYALPIAGQLIWFELSMTVKGDPQAPDARFIALVRDVTERYQLAEHLRQSEERFRTLINSMNDVVFTLDRDQRHTGVYGSWVQRAGMTPDMFLNKTSREILGPEAAAIHEPHNLRALAGEVVTYDWAGNGLYYQTTLSPLRTAEGVVTGLVGVGRDITERRRMELQLAENHQFTALILDSSPNLIFVKDRAGNFVLVNQTVADLFGKNKADLIAANNAAVHDRPLEVALYAQTDGRVIDQGLTVILDEPFTRSDGEVRWFQTTKMPLVRASGEVHVLGIAVDITERRETTEHLRAALEEKITLLREVHHRVKNNLQAIIYLMDEQAILVRDPQLTAALREVQGQARVMVLVYEQLYQSDNLARVDMHAYLGQLVGYVAQSFGEGRRVSVAVQAADVTLDVAEAMPCGLIINELLTNIYKYAGGAPGQPFRQAQVLLQKTGEAYTLEVRDDGPGLPAAFDWQTARSLGLKLVRLWATHQLGGTLELAPGPGTAWKIIFTARRKAAPPERSDANGVSG